MLALSLPLLLDCLIIVALAGGGPSGVASSVASRRQLLVMGKSHQHGPHIRMGTDEPYQLSVQLLTIMSVTLVFLMEGAVSGGLQLMRSLFETHRPSQELVFFVNLHSPLL